MSSLAQARFITVEDHLAGEAVSPIKQEDIAGEVLAMAVATQEYATIAGNVCAMPLAQVRGGPCRAYGAGREGRNEQARAFF